MMNFKYLSIKIYATTAATVRITITPITVITIPTPATAITIPASAITIPTSTAVTYNHSCTFLKFKSVKRSDEKLIEK